MNTAVLNQTIAERQPLRGIMIAINNEYFGAFFQCNQLVNIRFGETVVLGTVARLAQ